MQIKRLGRYCFTVKISECRNNTDIGYTLVDFQVAGDNSQNSLGFSGLQGWPTDYYGRYSITVNPNDSVVLDLSYQNSNTWGTLELVSQSEAYSTSHPAEFNLISSSTAQITKKFKWEPTAFDVRCAPYIVAFKGSFINSGSYFQDDVTLMVFVRDQTTTNCTAGCGSILSVTDEIDSPDFDLSISPNPIQTEAVITLATNSGTETVNFIVFDVMGKQVRSQVITNQNQFTFYKNELPTGVYIYKVVSSGKTLKSGKLVLVD